jgi:hypothetical protein
MDRIPLLVVYKKRVKAYFRAMASKLSVKKRGKKAIHGAFQAAEMGVPVRNLQKLVPDEAHTIGPRKPVWAVEKSGRPKGVR